MDDVNDYHIRDAGFSLGAGDAGAAGWDRGISDVPAEIPAMEEPASCSEGCFSEGGWQERKSGWGYHAVSVADDGAGGHGSGWE